MSLREFLEYKLLTIGEYILTPANFLIAVFIIFATRLVLWLLSRFLLQSLFRARKIDIGRQYAIKQFIKYFVYIVAALLVLQSFGIKPNAVLAGGAALLVGIGLGLQQTFLDLIAGLILLVEATVEVGDVVMTDETIGKVRKIGIRTSHIETRDEVIKIIPNSKMVSENIVNWSHNNKATRFRIAVGVSYQSDVQLVTDLLLKAASSHSEVMENPAPYVFFREFGNSSLDFELYFHSENYFRIERVKSEIRYKILTLFREHQVEIPFPQQDIWFRNGLGK